MSTSRASAGACEVTDGALAGAGTSIGGTAGEPERLPRPPVDLRAVDLRVVLRPVVFFAVDLRVVVFFAADLRAVVFFAVVLRPVVFLAAVLRPVVFLA